MMGLSRKVTSDSFNASKWRPDALVYEGVPNKDDVDYMDYIYEKLYMDKLWLAMQARARSSHMPARICPHAYASRRARTHSMGVARAHT
jgi:hypothetical protein